jgi:hypothetical protein
MDDIRPSLRCSRLGDRIARTRIRVLSESPGRWRLRYYVGEPSCRCSLRSFLLLLLLISSRRACCPEFHHSPNAGRVERLADWRHGGVRLSSKPGHYLDCTAQRSACSYKAGLPQIKPELSDHTHPTSRSFWRVWWLIEQSADLDGDPDIVPALPLAGCFRQAAVGTECRTMDFSSAAPRPIRVRKEAVQSCLPHEACRERPETQRPW